MGNPVVAFLVPLVVGVFVTMAVEAVTGKALGLVTRRAFLRSARRRLLRYGARDDVIVRGEESMYVIEFVPECYARGDLRIAWGGDTSLRERLLEGSPDRLPAPTDAIIDETERLRAEFEEPGSQNWNGPSIGVAAIRTSREGSHELPVLSVKTYHTDYAATIATWQIWMRAWDDGFRLARPQEIVPGMLNAIGLNATVVTDDGKLILTRRSARADSARTGFHISVNEGFLPDDVDASGALDPAQGIVRGIREELGLSGVPAHEVKFHTAMLGAC